MKNSDFELFWKKFEVNKFRYNCDFVISDFGNTKDYSRLLMPVNPINEEKPTVQTV